MNFNFVGSFVLENDVHIEIVPSHRERSCLTFAAILMFW